MERVRNEFDPDDPMDRLYREVVDAAFAVHREMGPGLLESVYESALIMECRDRGLTVARQVEVPVTYRGQALGAGFRADLIINNSLIVELKACDSLAPVHVAQLLTYLKFTCLAHGLLINFNVPRLKQGLKRVRL